MIKDETNEAKSLSTSANSTVGIAANDETTKAAFNAIKDFVKELNDTFGSKKVSPIALYNRLLEKIAPIDNASISKIFSGFQNFFNTYESALVEDKLDTIPKDTRITYGGNNHIYLDIQRYIHQSDEDARNTIRQHLLIINALLEPNRDKLSLLEKEEKKKASKIPTLNNNSREGQFINSVLDKAKTSLKDVSVDSNPATLMFTLAQSGLVTDLISGLQNGVQNGELDPQKLMFVMSEAMNSMMGKDTNAKVEEVVEPVQEKKLITE